MKNISLIVLLLSVFQCSFAQNDASENSVLQFSAGLTYPMIFGKRIQQDQLSGNGVYSYDDFYVHNKANYSLGLRWISKSKRNVKFESGIFLSQYCGYAKRDVHFDGYMSDTYFETEVMRYKFAFAEIPLLIHVAIDDEDSYNVNLGITASAVMLNNSRWTFQSTYIAPVYDSLTGTSSLVATVNVFTNKLIPRKFNAALSVSAGCTIGHFKEQPIVANFGFNAQILSTTQYYYGGENILRFAHVGYFLRIGYTLPESDKD